MQDKAISAEVLPVKFFVEVYNGKWFGFCCETPRKSAVWISIPAVSLGKDKAYFYDAEKGTLTLPTGTGYDAKPVDFCMGLSHILVSKPS